MGGLKGARDCVFSSGRPCAAALSWHVFFQTAEIESGQ